MARSVRLKDHAAEPKVYDGETAEQRTARRKAMWTPTEIVWTEADAKRVGPSHES